jgi:hypothetical protein
MTFFIMNDGTIVSSNDFMEIQSNETVDEYIDRIKHQGETKIANMIDENSTFSSLFGMVGQMEIDFLITNINRDNLFGKPINEIKLGTIKNLSIIQYLQKKQFGNVGRILSDILITKIKSI